MKSGVEINNLKKVHFIGVGGIGVSALARMMVHEGKEVNGSDRSGTKITEELEKIGVKVFYEQVSKNISKDVDLVIYSPAVPEDNPERVKARELGISELSYPEALGLISKEHFTVAVSGTHGKTTTTAMITKILESTELNPTTIVGSLLKDWGSNFVPGDGPHFIVEACEYKRSFLNLHPNILVITNIEEDHLDYYKDLKDIQSAFAELVGKIPEGGFVVCNQNDYAVREVVLNDRINVVDYTKQLKNVAELPVPGEHNKENAAAALAVAEILGVDLKKALAGLNNYEGTWRRFEFKGEAKHGALVYDDYAHNPTEVRAALSGAREMFPDKNIIVVFQPHLYSRTKLLLDDFAKSFNDADKVVFVPIYAAREKEDPSISSEVLVEKVSEHHSDVMYVGTFEEAVSVVSDGLNDKDVVITVGAGNVYEIGDQLLK